VCNIVLPATHGRTTPAFVSVATVGVNYGSIQAEYYSLNTMDWSETLFCVRHFQSTSIVSWDPAHRHSVPCGYYTCMAWASPC